MGRDSASPRSAADRYGLLATTHPDRQPRATPKEPPASLPGRRNRSAISDRGHPRPAEAAQAGLPVQKADRPAWLRQGAFEHTSDLADFVRPQILRMLVDSLPERLRVIELAHGKRVQPDMPFGENERCAAALDGMTVAVEDGLTGLVLANRELPAFDGEHGTHREAHQVVCVGRRAHLVEVIDAPDKASLGIPPEAEIFDVQVADREHDRCRRESLR